MRMDVLSGRSREGDFSPSLVSPCRPVWFLCSTDEFPTPKTGKARPDLLPEVLADLEGLIAGTHRTRRTLDSVEESRLLREVGPGCLSAVAGMLVPLRRGSVLRVVGAPAPPGTIVGHPQ